MLYGIDEKYPDAVPWPFRPCFVYDGDGEQLLHPCVALDDETGWCEFAVLVDGLFQTDEFNLRVREEFRPLPFSFYAEPLPEFECVSSASTI